MSTLNEIQLITQEIDNFEEKLKSLCRDYGIDATVTIKHPFGNHTERFTVVGQSYANKKI